MAENVTPDPENNQFPGDDQEFEKQLKENFSDPESNDLGDVTDYEAPPSDVQEVDIDMVRTFDNSDLVLDGDFTIDEQHAVLRLFPKEILESGKANASYEQLREMAFAKLYALAGVLRRQYEMREHIESLGGNCSYDLDWSMLSIVGEMSRLRTLVPKLEPGGILDMERD